MEPVEAPPENSSFHFDPDDLAYIADPYPTYKYLRENAPAYWWPAIPAWLFSRYDDVVAILRDPRFSLDFQDWALAPPRVETERTEFERLMAKALFTLPPPEHARIRKLVGRVFTPRSLEWVRQPVQALVDASLRDASAGEVFDVARHLAEPLPLRTIAAMMAIPADLEKAFLLFGDSVGRAARPGIEDGERERLLAPLAEGLELMRTVIGERRRAPGRDVLSALTLVRDGDERIGDDEIISLLISIITAGIETAAHLICFTVLTLLRHPDQLALLRREAGLMRNTLDEVLRYDSFPKNGVARFALAEVEMRGVTIEKGQMVFPLLPSAMRDPEVFPNPDVFDIRRDQGANVSFGTGNHHCIGAPLARMQGEVAVGTLLARFPDLTLAGEPRFERHPLLRKMAALPVRLA